KPGIHHFPRRSITRASVGIRRFEASPTSLIRPFSTRIILFAICRPVRTSKSVAPLIASSPVSGLPARTEIRVKNRTRKKRENISNFELKLIDPRNQPPRVGAVGAVLISKFVTQQVLFCADACKHRGNKQDRENYADSRTKSQAPSQRVD